MEGLPGPSWAACSAPSGRLGVAASAEGPGAASEAAHTQRSRWSGDPHLSPAHLVTKVHHN